MKYNMQMILQWILEGKEDINWGKVSPTAGQSTPGLHRHAPTEPSEPTSSSFCPYTLEIMSSDIYTVGPRDSVLMPMIYI